MIRLTADNKTTELHEGQSLLDGIKALNLDESSLAVRPLAAQKGGEIFNLNYTPFHDMDIELLRYDSENGRRLYENSVLMIVLVALKRLFPEAKATVKYTMGESVVIDIDKTPALSEGDAVLLQEECRRIVAADIPFVRKRLNTAEAIEHFEKDGQPDKAQLLRWRKLSYFDVYILDGKMDYFYSEMLPSTSYAKVFALTFSDGAIMMRMPKKSEPDTVSEYIPLVKFGAVFHESDKWGILMRCANASELNLHIKNGTIRELVRVNEALHEKRYSNIADSIADNGIKAVMLAGPSSSGKTTSAHRIATQLRALGKEPIMLSLDDFYRDRADIPRDENGQQDLEAIDTLDIKRFNDDMLKLLNGQEVELPLFDFLQGRRSDNVRTVRAGKDQPLIIEGIHGLNPLMYKGFDSKDIYMVYVSALTTLNLDDHNRIHTTDIRLLRRMVRDFRTRGAAPEITLNMWPAVMRGEVRWIFPYQENADILLNTSFVYEIAILKKYVYGFMLKITKDSPFYERSRAIIKFLNYFEDADVESEVPPTSILREFIGGNTFYE